MTKRHVPGGGIRVWAAVRPITQQQIKHVEMYEQHPLPQELVDAIQVAPLPLVWGFRRARRARPLPPAYVMMYHCDFRVPLDRTYLAPSLEQRCKGTRCQRVPLITMRLTEDNLSAFNAPPFKRVKLASFEAPRGAISQAPADTTLDTSSEASETELNSDGGFEEATEEAKLMALCGGPLRAQPSLIPPGETIDEDMALDDDLFVEWAASGARGGEQRQRLCT